MAISNDASHVNKRDTSNARAEESESVSASKGNRSRSRLPQSGIGSTQRQLFLVARCAPGVRLVSTRDLARNVTALATTQDGVELQRPSRMRERSRRTTGEPLGWRSVDRIPSRRVKYNWKVRCLRPDCATTKWRFSAKSQLRAPCRSRRFEIERGNAPCSRASYHGNT